MLKLASFLLIAVMLPAADSAWQKVVDLKSGSELRIYKKASTQPLTATFDEANDERIVIVMKNEQLAVQKADIERIDARPPAVKTKGRITTTTTSKTVDPDYTPHPQPGLNVPGTTSSTSISRTSTATTEAFETVYRRLPDAPAKN